MWRVPDAPGLFTPAAGCCASHLVFPGPDSGSPPPIILRLAAPVVVEADADPESRRLAQGRPDRGQHSATSISVLCGDLVRAGRYAARCLAGLPYFASGRIALK